MSLQTELRRCQIEFNESEPEKVEICCELFSITVQFVETAATEVTQTIRVLGSTAVSTEVLAILRDNDLYSNACFSHRMVGPAAMVSIVGHALAEHFVGCLLHFP